MMLVLAGVRAVHLACLMTLFGSAGFLLRLRARVPELGIESSGLHRLRLTAAALALISGLPGILHSPIEPVSAASLALAALLCGAVLMRRELAVALLAGLGLVLVALTSHATAASPVHFAIIGAATDTLHLMCGGVWLGGLCVLAVLMAQRRAAPRLPAAVALFGVWGMAAVALLALTGLLNATSIVLGNPGRASGLYLGVLGAKLVLVLAMILLALNNHFRQLPRLARAEDAAALKGNIAWELGLGAGVVTLASLLGLLPPTL